MNIMKNILLLSLIILLVSCGQKEESIQDVIDDIPEFKLSKEEISRIKYIDYGLDEKVHQLTENWEAYLQIEQEINNLKNANEAFFIKNHEILEATINDLKTTIPKELNTPAILARIVSLENALYKFENEVNIPNDEKADLKDCLKDVFVAFSNFNLQMNKKIERDNQKIEKP